MDGIEKNRMPLLGHLQELRKRLLISFLSVCVGGVACWFLYGTILELLLEPYCQIRETSDPDRIFGSGCELLVLSLIHI